MDAPQVVVPAGKEVYHGSPEVVSPQKSYYSHHTPSSQHTRYSPTAQTPYLHLPQNDALGSLPKRKSICGLRRVTFLLLVLLAVVIIVAAVGGGVGGSLAVSNAQSQAVKDQTEVTTTIISTVTVSAAAATSAGSAGSPSPSKTSALVVPTDALLDFDCPSIEKDHQVITLGSNGDWTFSVKCGGDNRGDRIDLSAATVYSFSDCLKACAVYNFYQHNKTACVGVEFNANLTAVVPAHFANCFLKAFTGTTTTGIGAYAASATLISAPA